MKSVKKKSLLYKSKVEYANFCINHVLGCAHGCTYPCYALLMAKRFGKVKDYADWIEPKLVENALELLEKEIPKLRNQIDYVHLCFTTDPFMYGYREVEDLTLKIIKKLNDDGIKTTTLTKGEYPNILTDKLTYGYDNAYGISLVSLSEQFRRRFEPFSAPFEDRIQAVRHLHDSGLMTWVSIEPYPTPNLFEQDIIELLNAIEFVDRIVFGRINYNFRAKKFQDALKFYEMCAINVIDFCRGHNIEYHIKRGTVKDTYKISERVSKNEALHARSPIC
ncbi:MAG: radical SAM protein [Halobacteriota archaeon]